MLSSRIGVRADWLERVLPAPGTKPVDRAELVVLWLCLSAGLWRRKYGLEAPDR